MIMCIHIYIYIHTYIHAYTYTYTYTYAYTYTHRCKLLLPAFGGTLSAPSYPWHRPLRPCPTPNLPTKIIPIKIAGLKLFGKSPMGLGIPPLKFKILLESNHLKSRILVRRLAVTYAILVQFVARTVNNIVLRCST